MSAVEMSGDRDPVAVAIGHPGRAALEVPPGRPVAEGVPDAALTAADTAEIEARAASVRGIQHRAAHTPRQDAYALQMRPTDQGDEIVAVVCDGVGSLKRSHEAAGIVAEWLARLSGEYGGSWPAVFKVVNNQLRQIAWPEDAENLRTQIMATTAIAVNVRADAGGWHGEVAWVGDSALWHLASDGTWTGVTHPTAPEADQAELHSTSSRALPSEEIRVARLRIEIPDGSLFLMTDGVANPLSSGPDVQQTLAHWWSSPPDLFTFGSQVGFARKSHMDDRTVIGLWRRS